MELRDDDHPVVLAVVDAIHKGGLGALGSLLVERSALAGARIRDARAGRARCCMSSPTGRGTSPAVPRLSAFSLTPAQTPTDANAVYIHLAGHQLAPGRTTIQAPMPPGAQGFIALDWKDGRLVSIEILDATRHLHDYLLQTAEIPEWHDRPLTERSRSGGFRWSPCVCRCSRSVTAIASADLPGKGSPVAT